ncbi:hypothetical protein BN946_scf185007.g25 [Trametes cinnabarina]|uniref:2-dehydropantoate 2-reductase n=1 Tax=Pycnoporus cinnabarinus TaxID=5643 RepID=A0A060SFI8_PYCCI|nr:hypothetical protein BN946_scf185007.g25 [Trametes cinnabarina]
MRIHVVGIGAVGNFVAFHLRRSLAPRHSVIALHRSETANIIRTLPTGGTLFVERDGNVVSQDGVVHMTYGESRTRLRRSDFPPISMLAPDDARAREVLGHIDSLVVTTKAFAVPTIVYRLRRNLSRDSTIVLLHNGMGVYERIIEDVFPEPSNRPNFVFCVNTHGVYSKGPLHTVHCGLGQIQLGILPDTLGRNYEASYHVAGTPLQPQLSLDDIAGATEFDISPRYLNLRNTIAALIHSPGLRASWEPFHDVQIGLRSKLVVNSFVNPVSALLQCKNGETLRSTYGMTVADRVCREAERVFRLQWAKEAQHLQQAGEVPNIRPFPRQLLAGPLRSEIERVVELTTPNYSSMYMDIKLRRPTEIDFLNGYIIDIGKKHGFRPLTHMSLAHLIKMRTAVPLAPQV